MTTVALVATARDRRGSHCLEHLIRPGEGKIFRRVIRRQDLDHRLVLDPDLDHVEGYAVAVEAPPAGPFRDLLDLLRIGRDAEREMGRAVAPATLVLDEGTADLAVRLEFGAGGIDLDSRPVIVELQGEEASRIGRKRDRFAAHQPGQYSGGLLRVACGDR